MRKKLLSLLSVVLMTITVFAGTPLVRNCGSMDNLQQRKNEDPGLEARMQLIEAQTSAYLQAHKYDNRTNAVITIPVVFHVVYSSTSQNISDAQCQAQVDQLNLDYARLNADRTNTPTAWSTVAANTNIQFCLAQRTPSGAASTGIERRQTTTTSFSSNDGVKYTSRGGMDAWPASSYLNIWSCNLGSGLLGYAQFPGGAAASDGVVLLYSSIGSVARPGTATPYHLGRTATHEVGHWLNLYHIWGDDGGACSGSDNVGDTPNQAGENYGCPSYPKTDACTASSPGVMFMNYMDYTDDGCMNMFTTGQSSRMNALFASGGARVSLLSSLGCVPPSTSGCGTATGLSATSITTTSATLSWTGVSGATSYSVSYTPSGGTATNISTTSASAALSGLTAGTVYSWQVMAVCSGVNGTAATSSFTTTSVTTSCGTPSGLTSSGITSSGATVTWAAVSGASSYTVTYTAAGGSALTRSTTTTSVALTGLSSNTSYSWFVNAVCSGVKGSNSTTATFTTLVSTTCSDPYESNNTSSSARIISVNTDINALISGSTDYDWFKFTTTSPVTNLKITLSNLPADYDIRLYNSSGTQLAISQNGSTTSETITRNTTSAATYYVRVYGYNGVYNTSRCYLLRVNASSSTYRTADEEIAIEKIASNDLIVYPNPAHESINTEFNASDAGMVHVRIFDIMGKTVITNELSVTEGINKFNFDLTDLNKGIYFIEMISENNRTVKKFILDK